MLLSNFLSTNIGQKVLLFFAPFFLSPQEFKSEVGNQNILVKNLHLSSLSPLVGSAFITTALVGLYRTLENKGWVIIPIDYSSATIILWQVIILTWLCYAGAIARYFACLILNKTIDDFSDDLMWPLPFWLTYYGGVFIVCGTIIWAIVGILSTDLGLIAKTISFIVLIALAIYLRLEIRLKQQSNRNRIPYHNWASYNTMTIIIFAVLQVLPIIVYYIAH